MKTAHPFKNFLLAGLLFLSFTAPGFSSEETISGSLAEGFRILDIENKSTVQTFTVYRGDYIKFRIPARFENPVIFLPSNESGVSGKALAHDLTSTPYFKMKKTGTVEFKINDISGLIHVIEYHQDRYQAVNAEQAKKIIQTTQLLILDVRTPREYQAGRLENASLLPVQVLTNYLEKLIPYKDKTILIYCATGNRSTVASKILIDNGFSRIINMRYGIKEWAENKYKIVR